MLISVESFSSTQNKGQFELKDTEVNYLIDQMKISLICLYVRTKLIDVSIIDLSFAPTTNYRKINFFNIKRHITSRRVLHLFFNQNFPTIIES